MPRRSGPAHVVVDGSNIATEGRSMPSLAQLSEAVAGFMDEHPDTAVTVVVDATFGHRIDKKEVKEFEEGIANNELVAPPAGAIGRGDAFVLGIADKANAAVLSNDSFQEFHGEYEWLFDEGRLIGGKPVPHVGWVFVDRIPVRGPVSRKATRGSGGSSRSTPSRRAGGRRTSKAASEPMPVPSSPPPRRQQKPDESPAPEPAADKPAAKRAPKGQEAVNDLLPFLEFVEHHPIGTSVNGTVDAYSSHGAYITIGDDGVRGYVPLRLMGDPPPRSARKVMKLGESVTVVVASFSPARRSIDCALPDMAKSLPAPEPAEELPDTAASGATGRRRSAAKKSAAKKSATRKSAAKKSATKKTAARKTATKKTATKKTATKKTAAKKTAAKKTAAKKAATKRAASRKRTAPREQAAADLAPSSAPGSEAGA